MTRGWLTIYSGPPASGKSTESRLRASDPTMDPFVILEGHGECASINEVKRILDSGKDVIYETTLEPNNLGRDLLALVNTIEVFRRNN